MSTPDETPAARERPAFTRRRVLDRMTAAFARTARGRSGPDSGVPGRGLFSPRDRTPDDHATRYQPAKPTGAVPEHFGRRLTRLPLARSRRRRGGNDRGVPAHSWERLRRLGRRQEL